MKSETIAITGLGMVSSLGLDVVSSCAAAQAGISRINKLNTLQLMDTNTGELGYAVGCPVSGITDGYLGLGRLVRLGLIGLKDLINYSELSDWRNSGLYINLSTGIYFKEWEKVERDKIVESQSEYIENVIPYDIGLRNNIYKMWLIPTILKLCKLNIDPENQLVFFGDQVGIINVIQVALNNILSGKFERCIIGGIDSYVEADILEAIYNLNLIKTPSNPAGIIPGECASFILLEREEVARRRNGKIEGFIESICEKSESFNRFSNQPPIGIALLETISETLESIKNTEHSLDLIIGSINGDPYRSYDWGYTQVHLKSKYSFEDIIEWYPALSFGEIGAATGFAAICMAIRGFVRGYVKTDNVLIWLYNDNGSRGSFFVREYIN